MTGCGVKNERDGFGIRFMDLVVSVETAGKIRSLVVAILPLDCEPLVPIFQETI